MDDVPASGTLEVLSLANKLEREGKDIVHLEVGQPDFDTPKHIKEAARRALRRGVTGYTSSAGIPELLSAISEKLMERGIERTPEEIIVTPGAKHSIFMAMAVALDPGDELLMPSPCWTYEGMIRILNAKPVFVETLEEEQFRLDPEDVKERISKDTKMLLLNYPNNPTGAILNEETLRALADLAEEHDFWILTDEVYDELIYGNKPPSIASFSDYGERIVYVNGMSKTYAMTGWRLGYTAAPEEFISAMVKIQQNSTTCATSFVQMAGVSALRGPQTCVQEMVSEFERRRDIIVDGLNLIEGIECLKPEGTFYVFPNTEGLGEKSTDLCKYLLENAGVAATPGSAFGLGGEGHIRISYANSLTRIEEALDRLTEVVGSSES